MYLLQQINSFDAIALAVFFCVFFNLAPTDEVLRTAGMWWLVMKLSGVLKYLIFEKVYQIKLSEEEKQIVAAHEAGHALMCYLKSYKMDRISIIPDGGTLGRVAFYHDGKVNGKEFYSNMIHILLSGMVAEEVLFGNHCDGVYSDLERARGYAYDILKIGMGEKLIYSMASAENEAEQILQNAKKEVTSTLLEKYDLLLVLQQELLKRRTLSWEELEEIVLKFK